MTATTHPDAPLVIGLSVLYEDEPDGRVIAHIPQVLGAISRGDDRRSARAAVRYYAEFADEVDAWSRRMRELSEREEEAFRAEASLA